MARTAGGDPRAGETYLYSLSERIFPFVNARTLALVALVVGLALSSILPSAFAHTLPESPSLGSGVSPGAQACNQSPNPSLQVYSGLNVGGGFVSHCTFTPGAWTGENAVYFEIFDGLKDHQANVTLLDPNAPADGLTNPVAKATVLLTPAGPVTAYDSTQVVPPLGLTIPPSVPQSGTWWLNVTTGPGANHTTEVPITVDTFYVDLQIAGSATLPGATVSGNFQVLSYATGGPVSPAPALRLQGCAYENGNSTCQALPGLPALPAESQGAFSFLLPGNATNYTSPRLTLTANLTAAGRSFSATDTVSFTVLALDPPILCASDSLTYLPLTFPGYCYQPAATYTVGQPVFLGILTALGNPALGYVDTPLAGAPVNVSYFLNGNPVTTPGLPTNLTTDASGAGLLVLPTGALAPGTFSLHVEVRTPGVPVFTQDRVLNLTLVPPVASVAVVLTLNQTVYAPGNTLSGTFAIVNQSTGGSPPPGWTAFYYQVYSFPSTSYCGGTPLVVVSAGNLSGRSGALPATVLAPSLRGSLLVVVEAHNGTFLAPPGAAASTCVVVQPPGISVLVSDPSYGPGSTIQVVLAPVGSSFSGDTYQISVIGAPGSAPAPLPVIYQGSSTTPRFSFVIPRAGTLSSYLINALVLSPSHAVLAFSSTTISEYVGVNLILGVTTPSHYSDGSFQPGESIIVSYQLVPEGGYVLQGPYALTYGFSDQVNFQSALVSGTAGTLTLTIPGGTGNGFLFLEVYGSAPALVGSASFSATSGVLVNGQPSSLAYEIVPGSGFTAGLLLLLILLVVVGLLAYVFYRRVTYGRRPGGGSHYATEHGPGGEVLPRGSAPDEAPRAPEPVQGPSPRSGSGPASPAESPEEPPASLVPSPQDYVE